jgi:hypothetical protein
MILRRIRITLRLYRFEVLLFAVLLVVLSVASFVASGYLDSIRPGAECVPNEMYEYPKACRAAQEAFQAAVSTIGAVLLVPMLVLTYVIGIIIGVPVVSRELERGTTRLAWSLSPSRIRWYLDRVLPLLAVVVVAAFVAGTALDRFFSAGSHGEDLTTSFLGYGARGGLLLAARAAFVFGVGVASGALLGRSFPALIVAGLVAGIGLLGGEAVYQKYILQPEATPVPANEVSYNGADLYFDTVFQLADGTLVGYGYFQGTDPYDTEGNPLYPQFQMVVLGERYRFVEAREAAALAGGMLVTLLIAGAVVQRRRPG